jgi:hypothetical protein
MDTFKFLGLVLLLSAFGCGSAKSPPNSSKAATAKSVKPADQSAQRGDKENGDQPSEHSTVTGSTSYQPTISTSPISLEQAKAAFTRGTGIAWPEAAGDIHFDEQRAPFFGDGQFYVVFCVPPDVLRKWLDLNAPWGMSQWTPGPVSVEAGCHCGFGHRGPGGWQQIEGGPKQYSGGDPEILAILNSKDIRWAARDRGPQRNPWYNGDLLILDPQTNTVRYCCWDM